MRLSDFTIGDASIPDCLTLVIPPVYSSRCDRICGALEGHRILVLVTKRVDPAFA